MPEATCRPAAMEAAAPDLDLRLLYLDDAIIGGDVAEVATA